jgi:hypothetical protein
LTGVRAEVPLVPYGSFWHDSDMGP